MKKRDKAKNMLNTICYEAEYNRQECLEILNFIRLENWQEAAKKAQEIGREEIAELIWTGGDV
jgi:hypothetical protein